MTAGPRIGEAVSIATWFALVISTLAILTRLSTKWAVSHHLHADDALAVASLVFSFGSGATVIVQGINGLGQPMSTITLSQLDAFSKSNYAGNLLSIASTSLAKLSTVMLIYLITPAALHRRLNAMIGLFLSLFWVISQLASAFPCHVPDTWRFADNICYHRAAFWRYFEVLNIVIDTALIALPVYILQSLQMSRTKKMIVLSCFGMRIVNIAVTAVLIVYTKGFESADYTLAIWQWVLIAQVVQCANIVTSCIPYLRPLLESYPSGMFMSDELRRRGLRESYGNIGSDIETLRLRSSSQKNHTSQPSVSRSLFSQQSGSNSNRN